MPFTSKFTGLAFKRRTDGEHCTNQFSYTIPVSQLTLYPVMSFHLCITFLMCWSVRIRAVLNWSPQRVYYLCSTQRLNCNGLSKLHPFGILTFNFDRNVFAELKTSEADKFHKLMPRTFLITSTKTDFYCNVTKDINVFENCDPTAKWRK
ncbi:Uncharacterized protein ACO02O_02522 [Dirofilaria immitis]